MAVTTVARRTFIKWAVSAAAILPGHAASAASPDEEIAPDMVEPLPPIEPAPTLLSAPIELAGGWGKMRASAEVVLGRMRLACLDGVHLLSDRQPTRLRVDEHPSGPPAVWLHPDGSSLAWVMVDVGQRDWSRLAYQFGHELGHVMANSWQAHAFPKSPCQWIEEGLVEAFSLNGLGRLAQSWKQNPPFAGDNAFSDAIADYRRAIVERYTAQADEQGLTRSPTIWFAAHRSEIEKPALNPFAQAAAPLFLAQYEQTPSCLEALGALNRWPGRTGVAIDEYLQQWEASCLELEANPHLPKWMRSALGYS